MATGVALAAVLLASGLVTLLALLGRRHLSRVDEANETTVELNDAKHKLQSKNEGLLRLKEMLAEARERHRRELEAAERQAALGDNATRELAEAVEGGDPERTAALHDRMGDQLQQLLEDARGAGDGDDRADPAGAGAADETAEAGGPDRGHDPG